MNLNNLGIGGIIVLIADIYAIISIAQSGEEPFKKALWIVLILVLPILGFVIWWFAGPKSSR
ncbi:MAG: PLD nuclease N-terminal domain-containing protein [Panacagrimonas sp.]